METVTVPIPEKQIAILKLLEKGLTQKEVSKQLNTDLTKVKSNIYQLCELLECKNSVQLVCVAIRKGII